MSEKETSCWASSREQELQSRLTSLREEKEEMSELLEMVKQEEQQLRTEMQCKLVALQTEVKRDTKYTYVFVCLQYGGCAFISSSFLH